MKLYVEESSWSGWSRDYKPKIKKHEYELVLNLKNVVKIVRTSHFKDEEYVTEDREDFAFTIIEINDDYVIIETNTPMSAGNGGISLRTKDTKFKIEKDNSIKLTTPTFDFGYIYNIELK